jgi:group I intron endonuclease
MERIGFIYKITNPTGIIYIGKTINLSKRKSSYMNNNNKEQRIIYESIKKYGWSNHIFEIIDESPISLLNELEIKYIKELGTFHHNNPNWMNLTKGVDGVFVRKDSEETKTKRVKHHIGSKRSEEYKKLMSIAKKGKPSVKKGWKAPESTLEKMRIATTGVKQHPNTIQKIKDSKLKMMLKTKGPILQFDLETGKIIREWEILSSDLAKELKCHPSSLRKAIKGINNSCVGYAWKYKNIQK